MAADRRGEIYPNARPGGAPQQHLQDILLPVHRRTAERAIVTRCSNRRRYFVFRVRGYADTIVLTCAQAQELLGRNCRVTTMAGMNRENVGL